MINACKIFYYFDDTSSDLLSRDSGLVDRCCPSVSLSVAKMHKTLFSQKLSNLELWSLLTTYRKLCNWAFQRTHY